MFQKIAKHRANDASNDVHRPPLLPEPHGFDHLQVKEGVLRGWAGRGAGQLVSSRDGAFILDGHIFKYIPFHHSYSAISFKTGLKLSGYKYGRTFSLLCISWTLKCEHRAASVDLMIWLIYGIFIRLGSNHSLRLSLTHSQTNGHVETWINWPSLI